MLYTGYNYPGPAAIRYPRGAGTGVTPDEQMTEMPIGRGRVVRQGQNIAMLSFGHLLPDALTAAEEINATVIDMRFVKPLDETLIDEIVGNHSAIITIEENAIMGGAGSAVNEYLLNSGYDIRVRNIGIPDIYIEHGSALDLKERIDLTAQGILNVANELHAKVKS